MKNYKRQKKQKTIKMEQQKTMKTNDKKLSTKRQKNTNDET